MDASVHAPVAPTNVQLAHCKLVAHACRHAGGLGRVDVPRTAEPVAGRAQSFTEGMGRVSRKETFTACDPLLEVTRENTAAGSPLAFMFPGLSVENANKEALTPWDAKSSSWMESRDTG